MAKKKAKVATKKRPHGPPKAAPAPLISKVELKIIRVTESHTQLSIKNKAIPTEFHTKIEARTGINPSEKTIVVDVTADLLSSLKIDDLDPHKSDVSSAVIQVTVQCVFFLHQEILDFPKISEEEAGAIQQTGVFAAYPYIRNFVLSSSVAMGMPPITLPLFRLNLQSQNTKTNLTPRLPCGMMHGMDEKNTFTTSQWLIVTLALLTVMIVAILFFLFAPQKREKGPFVDNFPNERSTE